MHYSSVRFAVYFDEMFYTLFEKFCLPRYLLADGAVVCVLVYIFKVYFEKKDSFFIE